ncbi:MAG: hypothetical protein AAB551_02780 [Patescibacteria group bacterium]
MKKTLLVSAVLGLTVLSGCSWGGEATPATTDATTTAPATDSTAPAAK